MNKNKKSLLRKLGVKRQVFLLTGIFFVTFLISLAAFLSQQRAFLSNYSDFYHKEHLPQNLMSSYSNTVANIRYTLTAVVAEIIPGPGGAVKLSELGLEANSTWNKLKKELSESDSESIRNLSSKISGGHESLKEILEESMEASEKHDLETIKDLLEDDWVSIIVNIEKPIAKIYEEKGETTSQVFKSTFQKAEIFEKVSLGLCVGILLALTGFTLVIGSYLTKGSGETLDLLETLNYESEQSSTALQETATSMTQVTGSQASSMQETVATLTQITEMVNKSVEIANNSSEKSKLTVGISEQGKDAVISMKSYMEKFRENFDFYKCQAG